ncbi:MAG: porin [Polymorphobacter sp.]
MIAKNLRRTGRARSLGTVALLLTAVLCPFALAQAATTPAATKTKTSHEKLLVQSDSSAVRLRPNTLGGFTPAMFENKFSFTAPGKSAATARQQTIENAYNFTPSGRANNRKALTLGMTSRVTAPVTDTSRAAAPADSLVTAPAGYGVDLAVGWKGFAVSGGYSRVDSVIPASLTPVHREAVDVGLSYRFKSWKTSFQLGAETGAQLPLSPLANPDERRYSAEVGAAYAVSPRLSVTGGVRYQLTPLASGVIDPARIDSSVYLGSAFSF